MVEQKVKRGEDGFPHNIFPVSMCLVKTIALVRHEQSSNTGQWLLKVENWLRVEGSESPQEHNLVHIVNQKPVEEEWQMAPSHVNCDWGLCHPGVLVRKEGWQTSVGSSWQEERTGAAHIRVFTILKWSHTWKCLLLSVGKMENMK